MRFVTDELDRPEINLLVSSLLSDELHRLTQIYGQKMAEEIGRRAAFDVTAVVNHYVMDSTAQLVKKINTTTKKMIQASIAEAIEARESFSDIQARINEIFKGSVAQYRSQAIAVTESTRVTGFAADEAISQAGIEQKEWLSVMDSHTRDTHATLDGQIVGARDSFRTSSGYFAKFPGGFGVASEDVNCRCAVAAVFDKKKSAMNIDDRVQLWNKRESDRLQAEKKILSISRKIFTMQGDAILKRMSEVHQEIEYVTDF